MPPSVRFVRYATKTAPFLLIHSSENLPKSRRLVLSSPMNANDGGDGGNYTVSVDEATSSTRGVVKLTGQLGGTADAPDVRGIRILDSATPHLLTIGEVQDGEVLTRSGSSLVGASFVPSGGGTLGGNISMDGHKVTSLANGTVSGDATNLGQLNAVKADLIALVNGLDWQNSVLDKLNAPPGSFSAGDRFLVGTGSGAWNTHDNTIAQYDGSAWQFSTPNKGWTVHVENGGRDYNYNGTSWVDLGTSIDHNSLLFLTTGNPHTQYQLGSQKDQGYGYAGLDADGNVEKPAKKIRTSDPSSLNSGDIWVNAEDLKYRDHAGSPSTQTVERQSRRNANNGYAGLDEGGHVEAAHAPLKAVYVTGGDQAIVPADIGAAIQNRNIVTGVGLSGGGNLTADRTIAISAFSGMVSQDHTPPSSSNWGAHEVKEHASYDIGGNGHLVPTGIRLPAAVNAAFDTQVVFTCHDTTTLAILNSSTSSVLDLTMQEIAEFLMGSVSGSNSNHGRAIKAITFQTRNNSDDPVSGVSLGVFRIRAYAFPRGNGDAL